MYQQPIQTSICAVNLDKPPLLSVSSWTPGYSVPWSLPVPCGWRAFLHPWDHRSLPPERQQPSIKQTSSSSRDPLRPPFPQVHSSALPQSGCSFDNFGLYVSNATNSLGHTVNIFPTFGLPLHIHSPSTPSWEAQISLSIFFDGSRALQNPSPSLNIDFSPIFKLLAHTQFLISAAVFLYSQIAALPFTACRLLPSGSNLLRSKGSSHGSGNLGGWLLSWALLPGQLWPPKWTVFATWKPSPRRGRHQIQPPSSNWCLTSRA